MRDPVADALPHRAEALRAIEARLFDLLVVVGSSVYHPAFHGSFSLKRVVPVLVPGIGYDDLTIADGQTPAVEYAPAVVSRFVSWNPHGNSPVCSVDGLPGMTEQSGKRLESVPSPFS